jgi:hypothetical protein
MDEETKTFNGFEYEVDEDGKSVFVYKYTGKEKKVVVPAEIEGLPVTGCAFSDDKSVKSITLPDSITEIGSLAFRDCDNLTEIKLPKHLKRLGNIGSDGSWTSSFNNCNNLREITLPESLVEFASRNFTDIFVDENNQAFTSIDGVLFDKEIKTLVAYPEKREAKTYTIPPSVTKIRDWAFSCCLLEGITLPPGLTEIGKRAFAQCRLLEEVSIPQGVNKIGASAFYLAHKLSKITFLGEGSLETIEELAFCNCSALESVTLPDSITKIGENAFSGCESLKAIALPGKLKTIEKEAFDGCGNLEEIKFPDSLRYIKNRAFLKCHKLKEVFIPDGVKSIDGYVFDVYTVGNVSRATKLKPSSFTKYKYRD